MPTKTYVSVDPARGYPAGANLSYECGVCGDVLPSMPPHAVACKCRNVIVDVDAGRVSVKDPTKFKIFSVA